MAGRSFWSSGPGVAEEWLLLNAEAVRAGQVAAAWEIEGGTPRQAGEQIEIADEEGVSRIYVAAPRAYAAGGLPVAVRLAVSGSRIELFVDADGVDVLVDPSWAAAAPMANTRYYHTATRLLSGKVLVAGGPVSPGAQTVTEIYDPVANTWSSGAPIGTGRQWHTATLLTSGKVLVVGGYGLSELASAELYDPGANTWSAAPSMATTRIHFTATRLADGRVFVAGGVATQAGSPLQTAEIYNPLTNSWSAPLLMPNPRGSHAATLLADGTLLLVGGTFPVTADRYDPVSGTWSSVAPPLTLFGAASATLLGDGRVLVVEGGAQIYDPLANSWTTSTSEGHRARHRCRVSRSLTPSRGPGLSRNLLPPRARRTRPRGSAVGPSSSWAASDRVAPSPASSATSPQ